MRFQFYCYAMVIVLLLAFSLRTGAADEPPKIREPDHLVPVDPYPGDKGIRYSDQIRTRFKRDSLFQLQMLVRPSFTPEYVVRMHGDGKNPWNLSDSEKVFLTYSIADKSIWHSMPETNKKKEQREVTVSTKTADLPKPLAMRLHKLWGRMLLRTRYPDPDTSYGGFDGDTYEFAMWCRYGEIWSPSQRQSPLLFVELGNSLIAYCKAAPAERPAASKAIEDKATQLEKYLEEHASK